MTSITRLIEPLSNSIATSVVRGLVCAVLAVMLFGCGSSSNSDGNGYLKFYNASSNSPYIYLELDGSAYTGAGFGQSYGRYQLTSQDYDMTLSWKEGADDYNVLNEQTVQVTDDSVSLVVLSGDIDSPEIKTYHFEDEDPEEADDQFTFRWINLYNPAMAIDVYISQNDETFNEAVKVGSFDYQQMSESQYYSLETYKFYLTASGSSEVLYESEDIPFIYTTQYVMVIRENTGPGESPFTVDKLAKTSSAVSYPDKNAGAQVSFYNALSTNDLLPQFSDKVDIALQGVNGNATIEALPKSQFSEQLDLSYGDYQLDVNATGMSDPLIKNHFLSLGANTDKTVFIYLTEEQEENSDGEEETVVYVNSLAVNNSNRISLYDHQVDIINLVDDFDSLRVYFVRSNETVDTAEYNLTSLRGKPQTLTVENNSYDVSVVAKENDSDLLLTFDHVSLDSDSGDKFMLIEEDPNSSSGYSVTFKSQQ